MIRVTLAHDIRAYDTFVLNLPDHLMPEGWEEDWDSILDCPEFPENVDLIDFLLDREPTETDYEGVEEPDYTVTFQNASPAEMAEANR
jgi:hypothetical protein